MILTLEKFLCLTMAFAFVASNNFNNDQTKKESDQDLDFDQEMKKHLTQSKKSRFLQNSNSGSMNPHAQKKQFIRVTFDISALILSLNKDTNEAIEILVHFLQKFIKVVPLKSDIIISKETCSKLNLQFNDGQENRIKDSDLHLYFSSFFNYQFPNIMGKARPLQISKEENTKPHPTVAHIKLNWNKFNEEQSLYRFQLKIQTLIHEVIHALGFNRSYEYWIDSTGKEIGKENLIFEQDKKWFLKSPQVLQTARKFFNSNEIIGIPLDKNGAHWDRSAFRLDLMAPSATIQGRVLTIFDIAVLNDNGMWDEVNENLTEPYYWGEGQGKEFVENPCQNSANYEEFSLKASECNFSYNGKLSPYEVFSDKDNKCQYLQTSFDPLCQTQEIDLELNSSEDRYLEDLKYQSKCFSVDLLLQFGQKKRTTECYLSHCQEQDDGEQIIQIIIPQIQKVPIVTCNPSDAGEEKIVFVGNSGETQTLKCPSNYERFCGMKSCVDDCSRQGICIRGTCHCNKGWAGHNCYHSCPNGVYFNQNCIQTNCPNDTFANPDNTCKKSCPRGFYKNMSNKKCELCDFSCSECSGPEPNECLACQYLTHLVGSTCIRDQVGQQSPNSDIKKLKENCPVKCKKFSPENNCLECISGYRLSQNTCIKLSWITKRKPFENQIKNRHQNSGKQPNKQQVQQSNQRQSPPPVPPRKPRYSPSNEMPQHAILT